MRDRPHNVIGGSWSPVSWRAKETTFDVVYENASELESALTYLKSSPPLVKYEHVETLRRRLSEIQRARGFLLQAGDCAETFLGGSANAQCELLIELARILEENLRSPVTIVGRLAGQFAKSRTRAHEVVDDSVLKNYFGDLINGRDFSEEARAFNPARLVDGYRFAARVLRKIEKQPTTIFTSHEAFHLDYESCLTRSTPKTEAPGGHYCASAHLLWLGNRMRTLDGAHVEYLRGLTNPIAIKLGPNAEPAHIAALVNVLNPQAEKGKIVLIPRLGADRVEEVLDRWLCTFYRDKKEHLAGGVVWCHDPMHGNTQRLSDGYKVRSVSQIVDELTKAVSVYRSHDVHLGGTHLELSHGDIGECVDIGESIPRGPYLSACDPRLNSSGAKRVTW